MQTSFERKWVSVEEYENSGSDSQEAYDNDDGSNIIVDAVDSTLWETAHNCLYSKLMKAILGLR